MNECLVIVAGTLPLLLAVLWSVRRCRPWVGILSAWAPLPAIVLAVCVQEVTVEMPWLLLGSRWGLDPTGRVFLGFTATLWLAAGIFARSYLAEDPERSRFEFFHLLTMAGNFGVIVALDMVSFLLFFTLMSLSAYGLITHDREPKSMAAGRTYIALALFGEILLFWAVVLIAQQTGTLFFDGLAAKLAVSPLRQIIAGLVLVGLGIKLGIMPLHVWLPLAHPAAPTPASAVLSGAIIKTGLLGLLRFLPLGAVTMQTWGAVCIIAGVASAFIAVLIGLTQNNPKSVLAYSSVSQMGLMGVGIGAALMAPGASTAIIAAVVLYATHHGLVKAALFLGVGVAQTKMRSGWLQRLVAIALAITGLSLAGLPLTSGFAAKSALKYAVSATIEPWASVLSWVLPLTGMTTALLVARFLYLVWPSRQHSHQVLTPAMAISWGFLTAGILPLYFVWRSGHVIVPSWVSVAPERLWAGVWPILAAGTVLLVLRMNSWLRERLQRISIPAGDLAVLATLLVTTCGRIWQPINFREMTGWMYKTQDHVTTCFAKAARHSSSRLKKGLENDLTGGVFIGLLAVVMFALVY